MKKFTRLASEIMGKYRPAICMQRIFYHDHLLYPIMDFDNYIQIQVYANQNPEIMIENLLKEHTEFSKGKIKSTSCPDVLRLQLFYA